MFIILSRTVTFVSCDLLPKENSLIVGESSVSVCYVGVEKVYPNVI